MIFAIFKCRFFTSQTKSITRSSSQQNWDFSSKIMQSILSMSVKTSFNHWICFLTYDQISERINSLYYVIFDFFTFISFTNESAWWDIWSTIILLIIRIKWITQLIVFMKIVIILIKSNDVRKTIMSLHFLVNDNWSYSKNKLINKIMTQSANSSENSFTADNKFAFRIVIRFIFKATLIRRYFSFFFFLTRNQEFR
jgi:hypothetical protein